MGVSKDVANRLQDVLKVKRADFVAPPVSNLITTHTNALIRVEVECNQKPVSFIVDTGSQLNIISEKVCRNIVRRPINIDEAIAMNDANGGSGRLLGLVDQVPIQFGHIKTPISAYVAQNPPFDGLLGRPWQRAHRITIAERDSGTYLEFPNPNGPGKLDLLVDPMPIVASSPEVYSVMLPEPKPVENGIAHITETEETETSGTGLSEVGPKTEPDNEPASASSDPDISDTKESNKALDSSDRPSKDESDEENLRKDAAERDEENSGEDDDEDEDGHYLESTMALLSMADERQRSERIMFGKLRDLLAEETPDDPPKNFGACTIVANSSLEFADTNPGFDNHVLLLRDARIFDRMGHGFYGHMVVKVVPYASRTLHFITKEEDSTSESPSVSMIALDTAESRYTLRGLRPPGLAPPVPSLIMLPIRIKNTRVSFLLDTGAQVNCIRADIWRRLGGISNSSMLHPYVANASGDRLKCIAMWRTDVEFGTMAMTVDLLVVEGLTSPGILGRPWQRQGRMWMEDTREGVYLGVGTDDGRHSYGMLLADPITSHEPPFTTATVSANTVIAEEDGVPTMRFDEMHHFDSLMNPVEPARSDNPEPNQDTNWAAYCRLRAALPRDDCPPRYHPTMKDLADSMAEITFEETQPLAYAGDTGRPWPQREQQSESESDVDEPVPLMDTDSDGPDTADELDELGNASDTPPMEPKKHAGDHAGQ